MHRILALSISLAVTVLTIPAQAGENRHHQNSNSQHHQDSHKDEHKKPKDPVIIVDPIPTPKPVVRDHRGGDTGNAPSGGVTVTNTGTGPIIRDHRTDSRPSGGVTVTNTKPYQPYQVPMPGTGPVVRDHRGVTTTNTSPYPYQVTPPGSGPVIRDHRGDNSRPSGGVVVTNTPTKNKGPVVRDHRGDKGQTGSNDVIGVGPGPLDLLGDAVGALGDVFGIGSGTITPAGGRPQTRPPTGPTIRDHR